MFSNSRLLGLGFLASLIAGAPLWGQSITMSCTNANAGATASCQISLQLGAATANQLSFSVLATAVGAAPAVADASLNYTDASANQIAQLGTGIAIGYTNRNPAFTGNVTLGAVTIPIPANAVGGQTYTVALNNPSAAQGNNLVTLTTIGTPATVTVTTGLSFSSPAQGTLSPGATAGSAYSQTFAASGGAPSYTWSISAGALPAGLTINSGTGVVSGTPTTAGTSNFTVAAKDSEAPPITVTRAFTLVVSPAITAVLPANLPQATVGTPGYTSGNITVTGGSSPYTFSTTVPLTATYGLTLGAGPAANTTITGTPTTAANPLAIPIKVIDANGATFTGTVNLIINGPLTLSPANGPLPTGTQGFAYTTGNTIVAGGGTIGSGYIFSAGGVYPGGLTVNPSTGVISGTPTAAGTFSNVQVTVTDHAATPASVTRTYTIIINPTLTLTAPATIPNGTQGAVYPNTGGFSAGGGSGAYTWAVTGLPGVTATFTTPGTTATLTGTPTTPSAGATVTVTLTDANFNTIQVTKTYTVVVAVGVTINTPAAGAIQTGTIGRPYSVSIATTGGTANYTWSVSAGTLPGGLTLAGSGTGGATGLISGTPTTAGTSTFTAQVVDNVGSTSTRQYSITVYVAPTLSGPASYGTATVASAFNLPASTFTQAGGAPTLVWSATGLPGGLTINGGTGAITGTPATGANTGSPYTVVVKVTDGNGASATTTGTLAVNPAIAVTPATLPVAVPGVAYSQKLTASGGSGSGYTFAATNLPSGLTISAAGTISGTAAAAASNNSPYHVTVTVTDSISTVANFAYILGVAPPLSISGPATLPAGTVKVAYTQTGSTVTATGGTPPYAWTATGLPPGLSINSASGQISGTPTAIAGSPFSATVTVTDANTTTATKTYSIAIAALPLQIITGLLPAGVINTPYPSTTIVAQGGVGTYTWSVTGLPAGLTVDSNGNISGTPTTSTGSPFSVVVTLTDATNVSISRTYSLVIAGTLSVATPTTLPAASLSTPYAAVTVTASGGLSPYTWAATGLPAGLSINIATGVIAGTPTTAAGSPYSVVVTVTDSTGKTASMTYSLAVNAPLTITGPASLPNGTIGSAYPSTTITAQGGSGVYTWSATGLPSGLSIASSTGAISGTPAASTAGVATVVVTVTDSSSATATKSYQLTVNPGASSVPVLASVSASTQGQAVIGPNTWVSIYGSDFAIAGFTDDWTKSIKASSTGALPIVLDGVSVSIGGQAAYVEYLSASQINVLTPNIGFGPLQVTVTNGAGMSNAITINSQQYVTGLFVWPTGCTSNCQPVATHIDFSYAVANGTFPGTTTVPAAPGETIVLWGSGFGPTTPDTPYGFAIPTTSTFSTTSNVTATLNNAPVTVYQNNAVLAPGYAGLFQLGVTVPSGTANGSYPLVITINGVSTPQLMLTVHN